MSRTITGLSKWDSRFLITAFEIKTWSKDNFKVGSIIVKDRNIISTGYNGFPIGFDDTEKRLKTKSIKRLFTVHAEINAILSAGKQGVVLNNASIYTTYFPCLECAKAIVQSGIKEVITYTYDKESAKLKRYNFEKVIELFKECKINLILVP